MPNSKIDLAGRKFMMYTVIERSPKVGHKNCSFWLCRCDCGAIRHVNQSNLIQGKSRSCGCYQKQRVSETFRTHGQSGTSQTGGKQTAEYTAWMTMKNRCYNKNSKDYSDYGGRGILMCKRWLKSFENFFKDMGAKPTSLHSIDRLDTNGNYTPSNCRWATPTEQANNKRTTLFFKLDKEQLTISQLSSRFSIKYATLRHRLVALKLPVELAVNLALHTKRMVKKCKQLPPRSDS